MSAFTEKSNRWGIGATHLGSYMRRWIARCPWFNIRIHHILKSDEGRDFHDHPFDFVSVILWGGYKEHRPGCWELKLSRKFAALGYEGYHGKCLCREYHAPAIVKRRATDFHRLELRRPAWTLVFASRYKRDWGFLMPDGSWKHFEEYHRTFYLDKP